MQRENKHKGEIEAQKMHLLKWPAPRIIFACNCASKDSVKNQIPAHNMAYESSTADFNFSVALHGC